MTRLIVFSLLILSLSVVIADHAIAAEPARPLKADAVTRSIDFRRDIQPIFAQHCLSCHGSDKQKGQLRLDSRHITLEKGGLSGAAITPGKADDSLLFQRVIGTDELEDLMPPKGKPLTPQQLGLLKTWINQGAKWPADVNDPGVKKHWAYDKPVKAPLPKVSNAQWPRNPIDHFVLARLDKQGFKPSPQVDRARLIRRVYLDLIGLPPSPQQVNAFVNDKSPNAYEKVVDELLASPHYGERWAVQWLDLARYADSNGFQADQLRDSWAFRDWVIKAMNADMPFDQFTVEQIAGDLLAKSTLQQRIATGFHRTVTCNVEAGVDPEENRTNQVIDRVNTTATVWLGTTMECVQCHNHPYDPFTMKDYYQLFAFFNSTPLEVKQQGKSVTWDFYGPKMDLPLTEQQVAQKASLEKQIAALNKELEQATAAGETKLNDWIAAKRKEFKQIQPAQWHVLDIDTFKSSGGASHKKLPDKSVLVHGKKPSKDTYTIKVRSTIAGITAFKLETLTDDSLPGKGPGRHHPERPNFVLYAFDVSARPTGDGKATPVKFINAEADFSQQRWDVKGLIDGKNDTGWAINPQFGKPHHAIVYTAKPLPALSAEGTVYTFTLPQHYGEGRAIGRLRLSAMTGNPGKNALPVNIAKLLTQEKKLTAKQRAALKKEFLKSVPRIGQIEKKIAAVKKQITTIKPHSTLVMVEMDKPRPTHIFNRGNFLTKGDAVQPGVPSKLHDLKNKPATNQRATRLNLARWLVDKDNPLVARVTVNRWWAQFFGRGIVSTLEDFGTQGEAPTHPQLLDWLAVEFVNGDTAQYASSQRKPRPWSMKHIHKLIVMSATYQQSSRITADGLERDPDNRLLARGPRFRMNAEMIRDNALAVSGLLKRKMHGPPIYPPQPDNIWRHVGRNAPKYNTDFDEDRFRRGVYVVWRRGAPYPSFMTFDAQDRGACVPKRSRTNTALQALTLMNDEAYVEVSLALAARSMQQAPSSDVKARVAYAFQLAYARQPNDREAQHLASVFQYERARFEKDPKAATTLVTSIKGWKPPADLDHKDLAAWFYVANILVNLDEMITKG